MRISCNQKASSAAWWNNLAVRRRNPAEAGRLYLEAARLVNGPDKKRLMLLAIDRLIEANSREEAIRTINQALGMFDGGERRSILGKYQDLVIEYYGNGIELKDIPEEIHASIRGRRVGFIRHAEGLEQAGKTLRAAHIFNDAAKLSRGAMAGALWKKAADLYSEDGFIIEASFAYRKAAKYLTGEAEENCLNLAARLNTETGDHGFAFRSFNALANKYDGVDTIKFWQEKMDHFDGIGEYLWAVKAGAKMAKIAREIGDDQAVKRYCVMVGEYVIKKGVNEDAAKYFKRAAFLSAGDERIRLLLRAANLYLNEGSDILALGSLIMAKEVSGMSAGQLTVIDRKIKEIEKKNPLPPQRV